MPRPATEEQIRETYRSTIDELYAFVSRRCDGDRDLAEDIAQETWLRAVRAWQSSGVPDRPLAWLGTVSARLLANHFRQPGVARADRDALRNLPARDEGAVHETTRKRSLVERALARLPWSQTRLLEAFHYDRRRVADIAADTGLTERAVEGRLRRARQHLRNEIELEEEEP